VVLVAVFITTVVKLALLLGGLVLATDDLEALRSGMNKRRASAK
jgi:hypothetical protein